MTIAVYLVIALWVSTHTAVAQAQRTEPAQLVDAEYARIRAERSQADEKYAEQEVLCYQQFAVNDCLGRARVKRREIAADLRRQELSISANEARRRGAEQISRGEEKMSPQALRDAEKRLLDAQAGQRERLEALEAKAAERAKAQDESAARLKDYQARRQTQRDAERARAAKQSEAENNRLDYELKQKAAAERKVTARSTPLAAPVAPAPSAPNSTPPTLK
jgi:colicin import membrane protein